MKRYLLASILFCSGTAFAASNTTYVQCNGNIGPVTVGQTLKFSSDVNVQDIVTVYGINFSLQLTPDQGLFDMLILRNSIDSSGTRNLQGYVIGFGANKMAYTDNVNQTNIVCVLNSRQ